MTPELSNGYLSFAYVCVCSHSFWFSVMCSYSLCFSESPPCWKHRTESTHREEHIFAPKVLGLQLPSLKENCLFPLSVASRPTR